MNAGPSVVRFAAAASLLAQLFSPIATRAADGLPVQVFAETEVAAEGSRPAIATSAEGNSLLAWLADGVATRRLLAMYAAGGQLRSVGLGDAPSDLPMLQAVDRPILVPRPDGSLDAELASSLPAAERAREPGAAGWNAAVLAVLGDRPLDRVGA